MTQNNTMRTRAGATVDNQTSAIDRPAVTAYRMPGTLGGIRIPMNPAAPISAALYRRSYPARSISGIMKPPTAAIVAIDDPQTVPNNAEAVTAMAPMLPRK